MTGAKGAKDPPGGELDDWFGLLDDAPTPAPQAPPSVDLSRKATPVVVQTVPPDAIPSQGRADAADVWEWDLSPATASVSPASLGPKPSATLSFSPSETAAALAAAAQQARPTAQAPSPDDTLEAEPEPDLPPADDVQEPIDAFIDFGWDPEPSPAAQPAAAQASTPIAHDPSFAAQLGSITTAVMRGSRPPPNPTAPGIPSAIAVSRRPAPATMMFGLPGEPARTPTPAVPIPAYQSPPPEPPSAIPPMSEPPPAPASALDFDDLLQVPPPSFDLAPPTRAPAPQLAPAAPPKPLPTTRAPTPLSALRAPTPVVNAVPAPSAHATSRAPTPVSIPGSATPTPTGLRAPPPRQTARARGQVSIPPPPPASALTRTPSPPKPSSATAALPPLPPPPSRMVPPPPMPEPAAGPPRPMGATLAGIPSAMVHGVAAPAPPRPVSTPDALDFDDSDSWATPVRRPSSPGVSSSAPTPHPRRAHKPTPVVSTTIPEDARPTPHAPADPAGVHPTGELSARREMRERFELNDFNGALGLAQSLIEIDPHDGEALRVADQCRQRLRAIYVGRLGSLDQIPVMMVPPNELRWLTLDHRAGFVLSLVDGVSTIDDIIDVSTMPSLEVLRTLYVLLSQNVISLRRPRR